VPQDGCVKHALFINSGMPYISLKSHEDGGGGGGADVDVGGGVGVVVCFLNY